MNLDLTKKCIESILKFTNLDDKEIIVVANGANPEIKKYVNDLNNNNIPISCKWFDNPLGAVIALNEGIKISRGKFVLLLNDDCEILESKKDYWVSSLIEPFSDPIIGCTGPFKMNNTLGPNTLKLSQDDLDYGFIIFFCALIRRSLFDEIGLLDENLKCGVDIDFCLKLKRHGYQIKQIPCDNSLKNTGQQFCVGSYPIWHQAEATVHDFYGLDNWNNIIKNDQLVLEKRYSINKIEKNNKNIIIRSGKKSNVLCNICTKNRYDSTLSLAIQSVITQTVKPDHLIIYDDNIESERIDLRENETYNYLFGMLDYYNIKWEVAFGLQKGQHYGHQLANKKGFQYVWRLDDDEIACPDTLEKLLYHMKEDVGAVGGSILTKYEYSEEESGKLEDIYSKPNIQWSNGNKICEVDHLHSSFLYRANIVNYCLELSPVAHREETIFSHELQEKGYKLIVDQSIITHHLKQQKTGIRSHNSEWFYKHDEKIFLKKMEEWGYKLINLDNGLGDHLAFLNILPDLKKKWKHLIIGVCFPYVFKDHPDVTLISISQSKPINDENIYKWMLDNNWKNSLVDAFRTCYDVKELEN
jgi:GT2 family glycosyltransferase